MSEHYSGGEWWDMTVSYLLASDPVIWWKWSALEGED